jgi:hypothetical protein
MDTTSLSFYGEGGETLGEHGYSKDYRRKRCFDPIFKFSGARGIIRGVIWRSACAYVRA